MQNFSANHLIGKPVSILLIGAGGSGSQIATELFQMDFLLRQLSNNDVYLEVTIADDDFVSQFNVGRQCFYAGDVGYNKADVLVKRFNNFGGIDWKIISEKIKPNWNVNRYDFVITAVDVGEFRYQFGDTHKNKSSTPLWLDVGNDANTGQVILGHLGTSKNKLPNVYDLYGEQLKTVEKDQPETPSCSTEEALRKQDFGVNRAVAAQASQLIWQLIRYNSISHHGAFIDIKNATVNPLKIDPQMWSVFGYNINDNPYK